MYSSSIFDFLWVLPWHKNSVMSVEIEINLYNGGGRTLHNVIIVMDLNADIYASVFDRVGDVSSKVFKIEQYVEKESGEHKLKVFFKVPHIDPNVSINIIDEIFFRKITYFENSTSVSCIDGVRQVVKYSMYYCFSLEFTIMAQDRQPYKVMYNIATLAKNDKLLKYMNGGEVIDIKNILLKSKDVPTNVVIFYADKLDFVAKVDGNSLPGKKGKIFKKATIAKSKRVGALHVADVGYLPAQRP